MTRERIHFMDSMRAILMMLGIVLHSAQIYNPSQLWLIYSDNVNPAMGALVDFIHAFRMPAFFVVSGYFCYLTLSKYKAKKFLQLRLKRIVVPLIITAVTLNSAQMLFLNWYGWHSFALADYLQKGQYISHLWFLVNIVVYFIIAAFAAIILKYPLKLIGVAAAAVMDRIPMLLILLTLPLTAALTPILNKFGFPSYTTYYGVFDTYTLIFYAPFFVFGLLIATRRDFLKRLSTINPMACIALILISRQLLGYTSYLSADTAAAVTLYLGPVATWSGIALCFYVFHRFLNTPSKATTFLADASYSVYLTHHFFVVTLGTLLVHLNVSAVPGVAILVISVSTLSLFLYGNIELIKTSWQSSRQRRRRIRGVRNFEFLDSANKTPRPANQQ